MKLKSLILLIIGGILGYWLYNFATTNFSQEAMAYKRYANALLDGDSSIVKNLVIDEVALTPFRFHGERMERIGGKRRFVWYEIMSEQYGADGESVTMRVKQSIRIDPPGSDSFFGTDVSKDIHVVTLVKDKSAWKVKVFQDSVSKSLPDASR